MGGIRQSPGAYGRLEIHARCSLPDFSEIHFGRLDNITVYGQESNATTWQEEKDADAYTDVPGFYKSATKEDLREHGYALTPGHFVGDAELEDDGIPFEDTMVELSTTLHDRLAEADRLESVIKKNWEALGYGKWYDIKQTVVFV